MFAIRTDIPHGNAALVECVEEDGVATIRFAAHPHGGTETLWWCFRAERKAGAKGQGLRLVWKHMANTLGFGADGPAKAFPVMRLDGGPWQRLPAGAVRARPDGQTDGVWDVAAPAEWAEFAFCFPHGVAEVEALATKTGLLRETIGVSQGGRPILRLANDYGAAGSDRPGVYCVSHQHASEMSGAWVLDGFLRRMAARGDEAPLVWSVPVANADGVPEGDYGKDPFPWDLNRAWGKPPMRHETLVIQRDLARWRARCRPVIALDFHSPGGSETTGVYAFAPDPETRPEHRRLVDPWVEPLRAGLGEYAAAEFARVARYASRFCNEPNFARCCLADFSVAALSFETPYGAIGDKALAVEDYRSIGARLADALIGHLGESASLGR